MMLIAEWSPCPYLNSQAFRHISSPVLQLKRRSDRAAWWAPSIQPQSVQDRSQMHSVATQRPTFLGKQLLQMYHWNARRTPHHPQNTAVDTLRFLSQHTEAFTSLSSAQITSLSVFPRTTLNMKPKLNKGLVEDQGVIPEGPEVYILFPQLHQAEKKEITQASSYKCLDLHNCNQVIRYCSIHTKNTN